VAVRYTNFSLFFDLECGFLSKQYDENLNPDKVTVYPKTKKPIRKLIGFFVLGCYHNLIQMFFETTISEIKTIVFTFCNINEPYCLNNNSNYLQLSL